MPKKVDANQKEITAALRKIGASVQPIHEIGHGCPDLLVAFGGIGGRGGVNILLEVKDGTKPPSKRKLTTDEKLWHFGWRGPVAIVYSAEEAVRYVSIMGALKR